MPSALASQLEKAVSLNAPLLSETARKKHFASSSYLFSSSTKGQIDDLDTIHALALNALSQLSQIYPSISAFDDQSQVHRALFSPRAKDTDRTLLAKGDLAELNGAIQTFLRALGPCLMDNAAGRVLEWLVRRFRINEFNVSDVIALFLPYHESPHFAKMVSILTVNDNAPWRFLAAYKASGKPVQRSVLVTEMLKNRELARFVVSLLPETMSTSTGRNTHRTLISFNVAVVLDYVTRADRRDLDAPTLAFLLPSLTEPLKIVDLTMSQSLRKDTILSSFVLLAALSQKCTFTLPAVKTIMSGMVHCTSATTVVGAYQLIPALISFLGPQGLLEDMSANVVDEMIGLPDFLEALSASLKWKGVENLILPILGRLMENTSNESYAAVIQPLITSKYTPKDVVQHLAKNALLQGSRSEILSEIFQRHPDVLRSAVEDLIAKDEGKRPQLEHALMTLAVPGSNATAPQDVLLASSNADSSVRASAVRRIVDLLGSKSADMTASDRSTLQETLLQRIFDTDATVLEALYAQPATMIPLLADTPDVLRNLAASLAEQKASRTVLRAHLVFFCNSFVTARPEHSVHVALTLVFPNALFSKPRSKTAAVVWDVLSKSRLGEDILFKGTTEIIEKSDEDMALTNNKLAKKFAENFKVSNHYPELLVWLLECMTSEGDAHTRLFSLLVTRALLETLSGENRIDAALKIVRTIDISTMVGLDKLGDDETVFEEENVLKHVVLKPSSRTTIQRLQFMILTSIAATPRPQNSQLEWFGTGNNSDDEAVGISYLQLQRNVYTIINTIAPNVTLAMLANHALFEEFGSDSLLFLASIWVSPVTIPGVDQETTRYISLRHASAFIGAQSSEQPIDFQVVLPSLLAILQASDKRTRVAAMECVASMAALGTGSKPSSIYAYDEVYGAASARLQYLEWSDEAKYLNLLVEYRDHLVNDVDYLTLFHHEHISRSKAENRKDTKQRQRILCFLLAHATCCPSLAVTVPLLKSISRVSNPVKLQMLLPVIEKVLHSPPSDRVNQDLDIFALQTFDGSAAKELNSDESAAWPVFMRAIEHYHTAGTKQWACLRSTLQDSVFPVLSVRRQLEVSRKLIELGSTIGDDAGIKPLLKQCVKKAPLIVELLQSLIPQVEEPSERASKKAKTDGSSQHSESVWLSGLTYLTEVLSSQELPGSLELISALLDTLSRIMASSIPEQADAVYVEQLLLTCLESCTSHIPELPNHAPNVIRTDVLVELMRTSENPQTFHQALLLLASLARLSSESVLHNVMPIFTFMGSNVFHRDDSYSFKVIQKTIDSIVPIAIGSLREKHDSKLDLHIGSRDLLRTFTDAATHIPRHRRTSFFTHLIDVLNPEEYLAPVLMLLADKSTNRVSRQDRQEAKATLVLPLSVMQHYEPKVQLSALNEILKETQQLARMIDDPASEGEVFLQLDAFQEQAVSSSIVRKRQCQTLLILSGFGMKQMSSTKLAKAPADDLQFIITSLMELATLDHNGQTRSDLREVGNSAQWSLLQSMAVISAQFFSSTILSMLSSENREIYHAAFTLLASRVPEIKSETREEISPVIARIVDRMKGLVPSLQDTATIAEAMKALSSISASSSTTEASALTNMLAVVIDIVKKYPGISQAITVIPILTTRLGPRVIPHLRSIIDTSVCLVKSTDETIGLDSFAGGLSALSSLLKTMPTFWGTQEIKLIVDLCLDEELAVAKGLSSQLEKLVKLLAKQIPSKLVISSLIQCWPSGGDLKQPNGFAKFGRFFELLKRCLHFAARSDVLENLRGLFSHFLDSFECRSILQSNEASPLEDKVISAYLELVVKLNETAFQPLFRKVVDWAFGEGSSPEKQITFCRHYSALLDLFKELMTPGMELLVIYFAELFKSFQNEKNANKELWLAAIDTLTKSFVVDDGVYWNDDVLRKLTEPLTQQIPVCVNLKISSGRTLLADCLSALIERSWHDETVKAVNVAVLMHTRSEDARVRILALQCSVAMWQAHGAKFRGLGSETATFIIECGEDENDEVVRICRQLKDAVQAEVGKIEGL